MHQSGKKSGIHMSKKRLGFSNDSIHKIQLNDAQRANRKSTFYAGPTFQKSPEASALPPPLFMSHGARRSSFPVTNSFACGPGNPHTALYEYSTTTHMNEMTKQQSRQLLLTMLGI
jgi:hypothetical protein